MAIASEGARCKCGSQKLDVAPSRLATSSSPDQRTMGGENSRSIPTMRHTIRQVDPHPVSNFSQGIADSDVSFRYGKGLTPLHVIYRRLSSRSDPEGELRAHRLV